MQKNKKIMNQKKYYNDNFIIPLRVDLGCGPWKKDGFIGIDNYFGEEQYANELKDNYNHLLAYLNV